MLTRNEKLLYCIEPENQVGVEIGPLDKPTVTRSMGEIYYIDYASTEVLRSRFSAPGNTVKVNDIVDVDYVWGKQGLAELLQDKAPIDYVIASHVIEHVPDLIGWLNEIRAILKLGGILSLVIPDKRQCFDYYRPTTRLSEVVEAYLQHARKPSPRQIFEHVGYAVSYNNCGAWSGAVDEAQLAPMYTIQDAWGNARLAASSSEYCDVHCWVFTPLSFFELLGEISAAGLLNFEVVQFYETVGCEFWVSLRATDTVNPDSISNLITSLRDELFNSMPEETQEKLHKIQTLQRQISAMESSKFWKMRTAWCKVKRKLGLSVQ